MTEKQKCDIQKLRSKKMTYAEIASKVGLSLNTVKSFCRRNKDKQISFEVMRTCGFCGKDIQISQGTREKKFCSDKCRMAWWNSHRQQVKHKKTDKLECHFCHKIFEVYGKNNRKYCSHECYISDRFGGGDSND